MKSKNCLLLNLCAMTVARFSILSSVVSCSSSTKPDGEFKNLMTNQQYY